MNRVGSLLYVQGIVCASCNTGIGGVSHSHWSPDVSQVKCENLLVPKLEQDQFNDNHFIEMEIINGRSSICNTRISYLNSLLTVEKSRKVNFGNTGTWDSGTGAKSSCWLCAAVQVIRTAVAADMMSIRSTCRTWIKYIKSPVMLSYSVYKFRFFGIWEVVELLSCTRLLNNQKNLSCKYSELATLIHERLIPILYIREGE